MRYQLFLPALTAAILNSASLEAAKVNVTFSSEIDFDGYASRTMKGQTPVLRGHSITLTGPDALNEFFQKSIRKQRKEIFGGAKTDNATIRIDQNLLPTVQELMVDRSFLSPSHKKLSSLKIIVNSDSEKHDNSRYHLSFNSNNFPMLKGENVKLKIVHSVLRPTYAPPPPFALVQPNVYVQPPTAY